MITASEITYRALSRNISDDHIRDADILKAEWDYIRAYVGSDLYDLVKANALSVYDAFIAEYVKPVLAYGVVFNIFERITSEISDRGVVQMLSEGATVMDAESRNRAKQEILESLVMHLERMVDYLDETTDALFSEYEDQEYEYGYQSPDYTNRNEL